jgi:hypothetical protein
MGFLEVGMLTKNIVIERIHNLILHIAHLQVFSHLP